MEEQRYAALLWSSNKRGFECRKEKNTTKFYPPAALPAVDNSGMLGLRRVTVTTRMLIVPSEVLLDQRNRRLPFFSTFASSFPSSFALLICWSAQNNNQPSLVFIWQRMYTTTHFINSGAALLAFVSMMDNEEKLWQAGGKLWQAESFDSQKSLLANLFAHKFF